MKPRSPCKGEHCLRQKLTFWLWWCGLLEMHFCLHPAKSAASGKLWGLNRRNKNKNVIYNPCDPELQRLLGTSVLAACFILCTQMYLRSSASLSQHTLPTERFKATTLPSEKSINPSRCSSFREAKIITTMPTVCRPSDSHSKDSIVWDSLSCQSAAKPPRRLKQSLSHSHWAFASHAKKKKSCQHSQNGEGNLSDQVGVNWNPCSPASWCFGMLIVASSPEDKGIQHHQPSYFSAARRASVPDFQTLQYLFGKKQACWKEEAQESTHRTPAVSVPAPARYSSALSWKEQRSGACQISD